jgi:hypothetical protein
MIGNTDWSNTTQHNSKMLDIGQRKFVPVPYDFDYSGFVNAPYAIPYDYLPIKKVTDRLYRGICRSHELTQFVKGDFLGRESQILSTLATYQSTLSSAILKNEAAFNSQITQACQKYNLIGN